MIPAIIMGAMAGMNLVGGLMQAQQIRAAGKAQKEAAKYQARLGEARALSLEQQAGQELAISQRNVLAARNQGALISGRARALAAFSGAGMSSPTIVNNLADLAGAEDYAVGMTKYEGESEAQRLRYGATLERTGAQAEREAGQFQNSLARAQANLAILKSVLRSGEMGMSAYSGMPASSPETTSAFQMGGFNTSPALLQMGSPMYQKYGQGGP